ncbi:MAG: alpha/beta fold hydrolase [Ktedonobacteraceae bacterium]|nr:alpha/beta fold hydrolase [Ktedonobacteraceae bacterium]
MADTKELSEAKRALLNKYLRGDGPRVSAEILAKPVQDSSTKKVDLPEGVVAIQTGGSRRPFFFLHGDWINGAYWCFPLAHGLGPDQPFYALDPYTFEDLPPSLETIAATHIQSLRAIQPEGPYMLGGFCNGGLLAYEIARQLQKAGQKIDILVLMDPMGLAYSARYRLACAALRWLGKVLNVSEEKQLYAYILIRHINEYLKFAHYRNSRAAWPWNVYKPSTYEGKRPESLLARLRSFLPPAEAIRLDYSCIYDWTAVRYQPADLYPDKITFFWDSEEPWHRVGWRKTYETNEVEIHIIPGTQMASRTTHLPALTEHLRICLNKVQTTN